MSAFVVDREHIDLLVAVALQGPRGGEVRPDAAWHGPRWTDTDTDGMGWQEASGHVLRADFSEGHGLKAPWQLGRLLWLENVTSVAYRYQGDDNDGLPGPNDFTALDAAEYVWSRPAYTMTAVEALKALSCYEYQSCEHPGWGKSEAYRFCEALRLALCNRLAGMDDAPWSWDADTIAEARLAQTVGAR